MNTLSLRMIKPGPDTLAEKNAGCENTFAQKTFKDQEATMATVLMTRLHDTKLQDRFHRLLVLDENEEVVSTYPLNRKVTLVGRSRRCQVQLKDPLVSVKHLSVSVANSACVVDDLGSSNGSFVNGERVNGVRVLNDGDEIMLGKTILRFAARRDDIADPSDKPSRMTFFKKGFCIPTAAVFCLAMAAALVLYGIHGDPDRLVASALSSYEKLPEATRPMPGQGAATHRLPLAAGGTKELSRQTRPMPTSHIRQALDDYAAGRLETAIQSLGTVSAARALTSESFQARQTLTMLEAVRKLHAKALLAQQQNKFAEAIESWDGLLALDVELVGNRPSFFSTQAERQVQALTYKNALDAFRQKNTEKARQLCQVILQIDPKNQQALALLAKIDSKA